MGHVTRVLTNVLFLEECTVLCEILNLLSAEFIRDLPSLFLHFLFSREVQSLAPDGNVRQ